jgi:hypothetical protein
MSSYLLDTALVYSFQGEDVSDGEQAELFRLAAVVGKTTQEMFRSSAELLRRKLIQRRSVWRAVLPPAIANRLAAGALQNIPLETLETWLVDSGPDRLTRSFSRRLGYLHSSTEAQAVVKKWLGAGGWLEKVTELNELGRAAFSYVAPVAPEAVLSGIERSVHEYGSGEAARKCRPYISLLRSIAYDPALFDRCIALMVKIVEAQVTEKDVEDASKVFPTLFPIHFSGTHATLDQRLAVVRSLVRADIPRTRALGVAALKAALESSHFGGIGFEFGARSRDFGYWPSNADEVKQWFGQTLRLAEELARSDQPYAPQVRTVIAEKFRGLWTLAKAYEDLERVFRVISEKMFWIEGWLAVRQTRYYDSSALEPDVSARLAALEGILRPKDLVQKVRSMVLPESVIFFGVDSTHDGTMGVEAILLQVETVAHELGKAVATNEDSFAELLPDLVTGNSQQLWHFGRGLAEGAQDPRAMWDRFVSHLKSTLEGEGPPPGFARVS